MMIETIVTMARYLSARHDDDLIDRMNYLYTPNALLAFSVLISFKQFGGRPLECMFPNKFPGSWEQYAESFCWSEDTYYIPGDVHVATVPADERYSNDKKLSYYQWVPFFLLLQAACFRLPSFIWKCFSLSSGIRVHDIVQQALQPANMEDEVREKTIEMLARHISRALQFQRNVVKRNIFIRKMQSIFTINYSSCYISFAYLFIKFIYLVNVVGQLYLMNRFLEADKYQWYGLDVIKDIVRGVPWSSSGYFPRVSLCDFTVRQVANIQKYTVQCVLIINIFNEKIFILLWFWYTMLTLVTALSILYWVVLMVFPPLSRAYIAHHLELNVTEMFNARDNEKRVRKFVDEYLKQDGVFLLRMVGMHAGILISTELVMRLYKIYFGVEKTLKELKQKAKYNGMLEVGNTKIKIESSGMRRRQSDKKQKDIGGDTTLLPTAIPAGKIDSCSQSSSSSIILEKSLEPLNGGPDI